MLAELSYEEDVVGIIKATNEGRAKKYEAKIQKMEAQLKEKDERIRALEAELARVSTE